MTFQRSYQAWAKEDWTKIPQSFLLNFVVFSRSAFASLLVFKVLFNGTWFAYCGLSLLNSSWQCTHLRALTLQGSLRQFFIFRRACLSLLSEPPALGDTGIWQGAQTINLPRSKTEGLWQRARFSLKHVSRVVNTHPCALLSLEWVAVPRASL